MGVWIEIFIINYMDTAPGSLPLWECGLKFTEVVSEITDKIVTPLVGVWIEIITKTETGYQIVTSLPLWECGLK